MLPCNCTGCILGRAPRTKETLPDFTLNHGSWKMGLYGVVSGYSTSTSIPRVDGLSTGPWDWGVTDLLVLDCPL